MKKTTNYELIAWSALVISILAMIVSWNSAAAANKVAQNYGSSLLSVTTPNPTTNLGTTNNTPAPHNLWLETQSKIKTLNQEIAQSADPNLPQIGQQISQLRLDLKNRYQNLDDETKLDWENNDHDLAQLEKDFKDGTTNAINDLQIFLEKIEQKINQ